MTDQKTDKICPQCKKSFILGFLDFCTERCYSLKGLTEYLEKHN